MTSPEGRQVTVRYAGLGDVLGIAVLVGGPADVAVQALADSGLFRIDRRILTAAGRRDAAVAWALAEELNRRLYEALQQTAVTLSGPSGNASQDICWISRRLSSVRTAS